jgi:hypothetical protein
MGRILKLEPERKSSRKPADEKLAKRGRYLPWLMTGTSEKDYPPPENCTEEEGRRRYGEFFNLWKLGVPLDFKYPVGFRFPDSFCSFGVEHAPARWHETLAPAKSSSALLVEAAEYDQTTMKPLYEKARLLAIQLEKAIDKLMAAGKQHPLHKSRFLPKWCREYSHLPQLAEIKEHARHAATWLGLPGHTKKGRRPDSIRNDIVARLGSHGLGPTKIEAALKILGLASAGNERERIRQVLRRQRNAVEN